MVLLPNMSIMVILVWLNAQFEESEFGTELGESSRRPLYRL